MPAEGTLPAYETPGSAGMDVAADLPAPLTVEPGEIVLVATGLALQIPAGYEAQVRPRSGLAVRYGLTVINSPGTIDSDYRGEVKVGLINLGREAYTLSPGDRIAQLVFAPVTQVELLVVDQLDATSRGSGGFGHTGVGRK